MLHSARAKSDHRTRRPLAALVVLPLLLAPCTAGAAPDRESAVRAAGAAAEPHSGDAHARQTARLLDLLISNDVPAQDVVAAGSAAALDPDLASDRDLRSLALSVQCRGYYRQSMLSDARRTCDEALSSAQGDLARFAAERMQATLVAERGRPAEAIPRFLDSLSAAERTGNALVIAAALASLGTVAQFAGANAEAFDYYDRAMALATEADAAGLQATVGSNLGYLLVEAGKADLARETFERALQAAVRSGAGQAEFTARNGLAHAQLVAGNAAEAAASFRRLLASPGVHADAYQLAEGRVLLARAELAAGNPLAAEAAVRSAVEELSQRSPLRSYPAYAVLIDALAANGKLSEAEALSSRMMGVVPETSRGRLELLRARARVLSAAQRHREAYSILLEADRVRELQSIARAEDRLAFMRARNESSKREAELADLRQQQALVATRAERDRLVRNFSLAFAALVVLGALFYWSTVRVRRRLEEQMARREHAEALGRLTSGVAHDFNNLMTIVQQAMGLLRRKPALRASPETMALIEEADDAARLGGQITQQLLAFARQKPMHPEIVRVAELVDRQRPLLERCLGEPMTLEVRADPATGAIRVDPGQLTTAIINLLVNARDAMDGSGTVRLDVAEVDGSARDRRWRDLATGRYVAIAVTDRGRGMTPDVVRQAVIPFFTTKSDAGGSGLGLSSVDGFVSQSGGVLGVQSEPGAGTTVTLLFPRVPTDPSVRT